MGNFNCSPRNLKCNDCLCSSSLCYSCFFGSVTVVFYFLFQILRNFLSTLDSSTSECHNLTFKYQNSVVPNNSSTLKYSSLLLKKEGSTYTGVVPFTLTREIYACGIMGDWLLRTAAYSQMEAQVCL